MGGTRGSGGTTGSGSGPAGGAGAAAGRTPQKSMITVDDLPSQDRRLFDQTSKLIAQGFKPDDMLEMNRVGREASEWLAGNRTTRQSTSPYTPHSRPMISLEIVDGKRSLNAFAGVTFGTGASASTLQRAAKTIREGGYRATVVNNETYQGVIVARQ